MKNIYLILIMVLSTMFGSLFSQGRIVINNNAYIVIADSAAVVIDNPNPNAITVSGTGGNIVTEGEENRIKWNIDGSLGNYMIPFTTGNNVKIPFAMNITAPGSSTGSVIFSTFPTNDFNLIYPSAVSNMATNCTADNSLEAVDRFWRIDASSYAIRPTPTLSFGYDDGITEIGGANNINESNLRAQRYNAMLNQWEVPIKLFGNSDPTNNLVVNAIIPNSDFYEFWTLSAASYLTTTDTIYYQTNGMVQNFCIPQPELKGGTYSYFSCRPPSHGLINNYNDTCFSYIPVGNNIDTTCIVFQDLCGVRDTALIIFIPPLTNDTIFTTSNTHCIDTTELYNGFDVISICDMTGTTTNGGSIMIDSLGCLIISPIFGSGITDTTCIIACDTILGICDTTYIVSVKPSVNDTIPILLSSSGTGSICLPQTELVGNNFAVSNCQIPLHGVQITYNDTCFSYSQTSVLKYLDTSCVIICDQFGICDTTVFIYIPKPTNDTLLVGPVVPQTNADTCVRVESTFMTGMSINTCDGSGLSNSGLPLTFTGNCVRYSVPNPVFTGDSACIILCDTILGVVICDTTLIVYLPDTSAPTVLCKNDTAYLNGFGSVMIDTGNTLLSVFDNTLINAVWISNNSFNCSNVGTNLVTMYARDSNRNMDSCISTITVLDTISPLAVCQNITIQLDSMGQANIVAANVDGGSSDNCAIANITIDKSSFDCSNLGLNSIVFTVTDIHGNSSVCTAVVTVEDLIAPAVYCPNDKNIVIRNTTCTYVVEDFINQVTSWDNCNSNSVTYSQIPAVGEERILNSNDSLIVEITARDSSGNFSICYVNVYARCVPEIKAVQFISPNGDGRNDTWNIPELASYPDNVVKVYNRWGNLVFEQKGYVNQWDGSSNVNAGINRLVDNKTLPDGTYFYIIDLNTNGIEPISGYVQLKR